MTEKRRALAQVNLSTPGGKCVAAGPMKKQRAAQNNKPSSLVQVGKVLEIKSKLFEIHQQIGQGTFSRCYKAECAEGLFAVKVQSLAGQSEKAKRRCLAEIKIHATVGRHPSIVSLLSSDCDSNYAYMQLELCSRGDLYSYVHRANGIQTLPAISIMRQVSQATAYLHQRRIIHRDIKLANIFLDSAGFVKLGDFGLATILEKHESIKPGHVGTPSYMAPELFVQPPYSSYGSDVWALGILMFALVNARLPFEAKSSEQVKLLVLLGRYTFGSRAQSARYNKLIKETLVEVSRRPTAQKLCDDLTLLYCALKREKATAGCSPPKSEHKVVQPKFRI